MILLEKYTTHKFLLAKRGQVQLKGLQYIILLFISKINGVQFITDYSLIICDFNVIEVNYIIPVNFQLPSVQSMLFCIMFLYINKCNISSKACCLIFSSTFATKINMIDLFLLLKDAF